MRMHTRKKFYKHSQCDKYFSNGNHEKIRYHFGGKTCCIHCGKAFPQIGNHINHLRTHTGERYYCSQCEQIFSENNLLGIHLRMHHGERFLKKIYNLKTHMMTHTGENLINVFSLLCHFSLNDKLKKYLRMYIRQKLYKSSQWDSISLIMGIMKSIRYMIRINLNSVAIVARHSQKFAIIQIILENTLEGDLIIVANVTSIFHRIAFWKHI